MTKLEIIKLYDKSGESYWLSIDSDYQSAFSEYVYTEKATVGRINWIIEQETNHMILADIIIFEPPIMRTPLWARLVPFYKWQPPSFRGRGLGSAMLNFVVEQAKKINVDAIKGNMKGDDSESDKYLERFYKKHGFTISGSSIYREIE